MDSSFSFDLLSNDVLHIIFDYLDFATLSAIAPVNKQFHSLSKERYQSKLETEVLNPAKEMIDDYTSVVNPHIILFYSSDYNNSIDIINSCVLILYKTESFLKRFIQYEYWIILIYNLELMESLFLTMSRVNIVLIRFVAAINITDEMNTLYGKIQSYFDILDNYFYVEYPEKYSLYDLKTMARFKKIPKYYNMKTSKLKQALRRPLDEVYYLQN